MANLITNEVLCFVSHQFDQTDRNCLLASLHEFYSLEELVTAKKTLISQSEEIGLTDEIKTFKTKRNKTKSPDDQKQKVVKDILDIWDVADTIKGGKFEATFTAVDLDRLPISKISYQNQLSLTNTLTSIQSAFVNQREQIATLTGIVRNLYRVVTGESIKSQNESIRQSLDSSLLDSSYADSSPLESPRGARLPVPPLTVDPAVRPKLSAKRKFPDVSTPSFIPTKQSKSS